MIKRKKNIVNKKLYITLFFGVLIVLALFNGVALQSTYSLDNDWSMRMSISTVSANSAAIWPGDSIDFVGDLTSGYDRVSLSIDGVEEAEYTADVLTTSNRAETGLPVVEITIGGFSEPTAVLDESVSGKKIYTWTFDGFVSIQTITASFGAIQNYTYNLGGNTLESYDAGEFGVVDLDFDVRFDFIEGADALGTCVFGDVLVGGQEKKVVDVFGVSTTYDVSNPILADISSVGVDDGSPVNLQNTALVNFVGSIASGGEFVENEATGLYELLVRNAYILIPLSFSVINTVGELDNSRFSVGPTLLMIPTSWEGLVGAFTAPETVLYAIIVVIVLVVLIGGLLYGSRKLFGLPSSRYTLGGGPPKTP